MSNSSSISSQPLWQAAELMSKAVILMENRSGSPWPDGYEDVAECLTKAWETLGSLTGQQGSRKQIDNAITAIDLAMTALGPIRGQWQLFRGHTEPLDLGDLHLEIGDCYPPEMREEFMAKEAIAWIDEHGVKLKKRAAKLRPAALRMVKGSIEENIRADPQSERMPSLPFIPADEIQTVEWSLDGEVLHVKICSQSEGRDNKFPPDKKGVMTKQGQLLLFMLQEKGRQSLKSIGAALYSGEINRKELTSKILSSRINSIVNEIRKKLGAELLSYSVTKKSDPDVEKSGVTLNSERTIDLETEKSETDTWHGTLRYDEDRE